MVFEADTLLQIFKLNWSLTDQRVTLEGSAAAVGKIRPIKIFAHEQIQDKIATKSIEIIKQTPLISRDLNEFFTTETDEFLIRGYYKIQGTSKEPWDISESDVEDIETEIERIIGITFNPQNGTNIFFTISYNWTNKDSINVKQDPIIVRELRIRLTKITSGDSNVFDSFQRGVIFDLSASSNMDNPPGGDVNYTEVFNVAMNEGFREKEVQVTDHPDGPGIPLFYSGGFGGIITFDSYFRSNDVGADTADLNQIHLRQSNGEKATVAMVRTYTNNNSQTITLTTIIRVMEIKITEPQSNLLQWQILGKIIKPTTMVIT